MTDWHEQLLVPRAAFIPSVVWVDDIAAGGFVAVSRDDDKSRWCALVQADAPIVTQVDDGATKPGETGQQPSSSCSQPSLVAAMLTALDVRGGHHVLEIGAGTGWNAALLAARAGERGRVVSVEVDPTVAECARRALADAGCSAVVVTGDGTEGHVPDAPYDRVMATASVRAIPTAWLEQTRPGGVIVAPWGSDYGDDALTGRGGRELFEMVTFTRAGFTIGLRVPSCYLTVEDLTADRRHVELHDVSSGSWARVTLVRGQDSWTVHQLGPRRLWDEVDTAYVWWREAGESTPDRYGLTVTPDGAHTVWLDTPDGPRWNPHLPV